MPHHGHSQPRSPRMDSRDLHESFDQGLQSELTAQERMALETDGIVTDCQLSSVARTAWGGWTQVEACGRDPDSRRRSLQQMCLEKRRLAQPWPPGWKPTGGSTGEPLELMQSDRGTQDVPPTRTTQRSTGSLCPQGTGARKEAWGGTHTASLSFLSLKHRDGKKSKKAKEGVYAYE